MIDKFIKLLVFIIINHYLAVIFYGIILNSGTLEILTISKD